MKNIFLSIARKKTSEKSCFTNDEKYGIISGILVRIPGHDRRYPVKMIKIKMFIYHGKYSF